MYPLRSFLIHCLIAVILPWGALAQAASAQASVAVTPKGSEIIVPSAEAASVAPKQKRCRLAILIGAPCFAAIHTDEIAAKRGIPQESKPLFSIATLLPDGVMPEGYLDPPRRG